MKGIDRTAVPYIKAMAILARTDPDSASGPVKEDFPVPPPRKRARRQQPLAHEDSQEQYAGTLTNRDCSSMRLSYFPSASELATNGPAVQKSVAEARRVLKDATEADTIGSLRLQEAELRSRIGFANAQLRYILDHREFLLKDLKRVLDAQHQRSEPSSASASQANS